MNRLTFLLVGAFVTYASGENCDEYGIRLYEDLACKPLNNGGSCPSSYDCKLQPPKSNQCVVRDKVYNVGDSIPTDKQSHTCEFGCSCSLPRVNCPQWGCANWAGQPPVPIGCHREYSLDSCCSTGILCPPFNDTTVCTVDGIDYKAGEKFFPKDSCYACLCQKGYNGKFEKPFCKRAGCDAQVRNQDEIQKSCAPVYFKQSDNGKRKCCPTVWACPDGTEVIGSSGKKSESTCKFGDKIFQIGDTLEKEIKYRMRPKKIKCECKIPPLLLCEEA